MKSGKVLSMKLIIPVERSFKLQLIMTRVNNFWDQVEQWHYCDGKIDFGDVEMNDERIKIIGLMANSEDMKIKTILNNANKIGAFITETYGGSGPKELRLFEADLAKNSGRYNFNGKRKED